MIQMNILYHGISYNMNHLSRGGFLTRSKRSGPTKVVKRRTAALHKKRGHRKTQKQGGLWNGSIWW